MPDGLIGTAATPYPACRVKASSAETLKGAEAVAADQDFKFLKDIEDGDESFSSRSPWDRRRGDDLNTADAQGATAVHHAMKHDAEKFLKPLIEKGAFVEFPDRDGARPIAWAIRENNVPAVKMLLELKDRTSRPIVERSQTVTKPNQNTLLHEAAWYDRGEIVELLLADQKEDGKRAFEDQLELYNKVGMTPLHVASLRSGPAVCDMLIKAGANMNATTSNPRVVAESAMDIAITDGKTATVDLLKSLSVTTTSVIFAARMKKKGEAK